MFSIAALTESNLLVGPYLALFVSLGLDGPFTPESVLEARRHYPF